MLQNNHGVRYVEFGMRMLASTIDSLLSAVILYPIYIAFNKIYGSDELMRSLASGGIRAEDLSEEQVIDLFTRFAMSFTLQNAILAVVVIIFWIYCSATPGKMLLKMKIIDVKTGLQPSKRQMLIRYLGYILAVLPLGLGFIWIYYDKKKQGWHDKLAGTAVVYI